jgi:hypothetical protein
MLDPANPGFYLFHPLGSSLNPREAWRRKGVVRDLQAPASQRRDKVYIPWPSVVGLEVGI